MKQNIKNKIPAQSKTTAIRKEFYKRLIYICLGIIPIPFVWEQRGTERFIALPGFIFSMYQFISIISMSQLIVDDFFPPKTSFEKTTKPINKFISYFAMTLFFSGLVFLIFEGRVIENTINEASFFWKSAFIGIAIATLLTIVLKRTISSVYDESTRRYSVHFGVFTGFFLLTPAIASYINHTYAEKKENCKAYEIVSKSTGGKRNGSSRLFLKLDNNSEQRFQVRREFYDKVGVGEQVQLCTKKGKFGYYFVEEFKSIDK